MKKIIVLLLIIPLFTFAQRGGGGRPKVENIFHDYEFWKQQPSLDLVKQKVKEGNDPVKQNQGAFDALSYAIMTNNSVATIDYLLSIPGNDVNKLTHDGRSYLIWAGYAGNLELIKYLLNKGADSKVVGSHGFNWFTFTVNSGHENTKIYDLMIENGVDVKETNRTGANAILLLAPHSKDGKIIEYFQEKGVDINATDKKGNNILFYAAKRGNINLMKKYVAQGFDYKKTNDDGENIVLYASHGARGYSNPLEVYEYLYSLGLDLNKVNQKGETALQLVARGAKDQKIIDFFIAHGADVTKQDDKGNTAFLNAVQGNNLSVVEKLISTVKNINQKNADGHSALVLATKNINLEIFNFLVNNGADVQVVDADKNNLFYYLFNVYNRRNAKNFDPFVNTLKKAGVSFKNASANNSPLHIAIAKGDQKLINTALELGAEINQKNNEGLTPLHLAAMKAKSPRLLKMLLNKGADKTAVTDFDESAFDLAKENELLKGADINFLKP